MNTVKGQLAAFWDSLVCETSELIKPGANLSPTLAEKYRFAHGVHTVPCPCDFSLQIWGVVILCVCTQATGSLTGDLFAAGWAARPVCVCGWYMSKRSISCSC